MRIHTNEGEEEAPLNLTPLIDMVFLLLIFFLVATQLAQKEREHPMQLPPDAAAQALSSPPKQLIINIMQDGTLKVAGVAYEPKDLQAKLAAMAQQDPGREVLIRADERSIHMYFAGVARMCRIAGINEVKIGYLFTQGEVAAQ